MNTLKIREKTICDKYVNHIYHMYIRITVFGGLFFTPIF